MCMSFTQRQKALDMLKEIRQMGGPELLRVSEQTPSVKIQSPFDCSFRKTPERLEQAVLSLFKKLKSREVDEDTAERLVDECISHFEKDKEEVEKICADSRELADLREAWARQTQTVVEALDETLFAYFEGSDLQALAQYSLRVKTALQERRPYYSRLPRASVREEQVA